MKLVINESNPATEPDPFDQFWKLYPRRVAKADARKAWAKIRAEDRQKILEVLPDHLKQDQWTKDGGQFIPYPASWLNGERWEDDLVIQIKSQLGQCEWNMHGTREAGGRCEHPATEVHQNGSRRCALHIGRN